MRQGMVTGVGLQGPGLLIPTRGPTQGAINLAPTAPRKALTVVLGLMMCENV
jgi:hypothetical protein